MSALRRIVCNKSIFSSSSLSSNNFLRPLPSISQFSTISNPINRNNNSINLNSTSISHKTNLNSITIRPFQSTIAKSFAHGTVAPTEGKLVPITFLDHKGTRRTVLAECGLTLLEVSRIYDIDILGSCQGGGDPVEVYGEGPACKSCHVFIDNQHLKTLPPKAEREERLTFFISESNENSRFACELIVDETFANMTVVIPETSTYHRQMFFH